MNLLAKICKRATIVLSFWLISCESSDDLGLELNGGDSETEVRFLEFILPASTVYIDSLRTDEGENIIVGSNIDNVYGSTSVTTYVNIDYSSGALPSDTLTLDSARLTLPITQVLHSDDLIELALDVRSLTDTVFSSAIYFADDEIESSPIILDTWRITLTEEDTLFSVALSETLRNEIWETARNADDITDINFGISLNSNDLNEGIVSLNITADTSILQFFTRNTGDSSFTTVFNLENQFHNIQRDRSGAVLAGLQNTGDSLLTNTDQTYFNPLAGIATKLDLTEFTEFIANNDNIIVNKADISMEASEDDVNALGSKIQLFSYYFYQQETVINGPGILGDIFNTALLEESQYGQFSGAASPRIVSINSSTNSYSETVTLFSQILLQNNLEGSDFLTSGFVTISNAPMTLEQTSFLKSEIKFRVFYTILN